jgi:hypothetical protein
MSPTEIITSRAPTYNAKGKLVTLGYVVSYGPKRTPPPPGFGAALLAIAETERARREAEAAK